MQTAISSKEEIVLKVHRKAAHFELKITNISTISILKTKGGGGKIYNNKKRLAYLLEISNTISEKIASKTTHLEQDKKCLKFVKRKKH